MTHCALMYDTFSFDGHYCMVFECLGPSLYDFLKGQKYHPFPIQCVRDFARQLLETLEFLHSFRLIHTDLKVRVSLIQCVACDLVPFCLFVSTMCC
jgi:serine/threonine protein kinase